MACCVCDQRPSPGPNESPDGEIGAETASGQVEGDSHKDGHDVAPDPARQPSAESNDLEKTIEELKTADNSEVLGRLFGLLETQKVQQQAMLSKMQCRQEEEERKQKILSALYSRDMPLLRTLLQGLGSSSALVTIRDDEGLTVAHHAVRLGLYPVLEWTLRQAPSLADSVTNPSGRPANWTPMMILVDSAPGAIGGADAAYEMVKMLLVHMSATGLQSLVSEVCVLSGLSLSLSLSGCCMMYGMLYL